jgi:hypothetical protein
MQEEADITYVVGVRSDLSLDDAGDTLGDALCKRIRKQFQDQQVRPPPPLLRPLCPPPAPPPPAHNS